MAGNKFFKIFNSSATGWIIIFLLLLLVSFVAVGIFSNKHIKIGGLEINAGTNTSPKKTIAADEVIDTVDTNDSSSVITAQRKLDVDDLLKIISQIRSQTSHILIYSQQDAESIVYKNDIVNHLREQGYNNIEEKFTKIPAAWAGKLQVETSNDS